MKGIGHMDAGVTMCLIPSLALRTHHPMSYVEVSWALRRPIGLYIHINLLLLAFFSSLRVVFHSHEEKQIILDCRACDLQEPVDEAIILADPKVRILQGTLSHTQLRRPPVRVMRS